ncbi:MAG: 2-oxoacid:ferredoxin oxidoreductase subunit beta [Propionibacteriaceae bacterium]|jgi:2-oxoglutarate ferredoxin oxidoreductase subunit beta|nr:2-oxoacid:ferredoxin oxidoreductase subunit beta [Propionibacteriaceae bacterium]
MTDATLPSGLSGVPLATGELNRKDFASDQEVRWCPGCGDYSILATFQGLLPQLGIRRENTVIVSGIGCSSRFPYYMNTYGVHSIHGRAPALATGIAIARPDLSVWVVTGDGDALSIGGNHLIHALRRNVNITIMLFNNRIYGLTKGQASPTSEIGKVTKSTPKGLVDEPFNTVALALGAGATFVARTMDSSRAHLAETLAAAVGHRGASLVEIYQNCQIFNDGAFDALKGPDSGLIPLVHGQPVVFGKDGSQCVYRTAEGSLAVGPTDQAPDGSIIVHDAHREDAGLASELAALTDLGVIRRSPIGIFRDVDHPTHDDLARAQVTMADDPAERLAALQDYVTGPDTWTV